MPIAPKDVKGVRSFTAPLLGIVFLLTCYVVVAQWQDLPHLMDSALASINLTP